MSKSQRLKNLNTPSTKTTKPKSSVKWRSIIALILMYLVLFMNWEWAWGILFLIWVIPDLFSGITYFVEPISKRENPTLYWCIVITWIAFSIYSLSTLFIDYQQHY